jgi:hypothetical protein
MSTAEICSVEMGRRVPRRFSRLGNGLCTRQAQRLRRSFSRPDALLIAGGVAGMIFGVASAAYLLVGEGLPQAGPVQRQALITHEDVTASVPASDIKPPDQGRREVPSEAPAANIDLHGPRSVPTESVAGDPSVWAGVREFVPLPPDEVPVLEEVPPIQATPAPVPSSTISPAIPQRSHTRTKVSRGPHAKRAKRTVRRQRTLTGDNAQSDVGGKKMTGAELQREGTTNPLVSALSAVFGPK